MLWIFWEDKEGVPIWCLYGVVKIDYKNNKQTKANVKLEDWCVPESGQKGSKVKLEKINGMRTKLVR